MRNITIITTLLLLISCQEKKKDVVSTLPPNGETKAVAQRQIIAVDEKHAIKETRVLYKTTNSYGSRMFSIPNGREDQVILRITGGIKLQVIETKQIQMGSILGNWYKVKYDNYTGWVSGFTMEEKEELIISSADEKIKNYEKQIGKRPQNNPINGKIKMVDEWIKKNSVEPKSVDYLQWYEAFPQNDYWVCRVDFTTKNELGGSVREDILFHIKYGVIVAVFDKIGNQLY